MKFTELVLTFGIVAFLGVSSAGFLGNLPEMRLKSAAFKVYSMCVEARNIALRNDCYCGVIIDKTPDGTRFLIVRDKNFNGVHYREYLSGKDEIVDEGFVLEKNYPGVKLKKVGFSGRRVISFSPYLTSSNGSIYLETENPDIGIFRIKVYGKSFVLKPVKIFPDGSEVNYD